jgi:hypothetical protein
LAASLRSRVYAAGIHVLISAGIASAAGVLTFVLWYPGAIGDMAGGPRLFLLLLAVDVALGPLLTFFVADYQKSRGELVRDLFVIAVVQAGALVYGMQTVYVARPVALVYEPGRFRLVAANEVLIEELERAPAPYRKLSLTGPQILGTRAAKSSDERLESIDLAFKGFDKGQRPIFWQPFADSRADALAHSQPIADLIGRYANRRSEIEAVLRELKLQVKEARFLPVLARSNWVAILNSRGDVAGYAPFDGF